MLKVDKEQHINTGDSGVDGSESERGGFQGHPLCEFCRTPFYGDNELYMHMSTEHFTCHICKRQNPGQFEYYKNYEDLEAINQAGNLQIHFRQGHFLCEDEACLSKKLVVFRSEGEMKLGFSCDSCPRPSAKFNSMSIRKKKIRLEEDFQLFQKIWLPTAFTYQRSNEQDNRRGRRHVFQHNVAEHELPQAIEASFETANLNTRFPESMHGFEPLLQSSATIGTESDRRYFTAVSHSLRNAPLEDSSFPPLSTGPSGSAPMPDGPPRNTMADNLRRLHPKIKINVLND
ncbi:RING/U-box superfamily protein [Artemisia annua]|uniref:RING/U-box superfamily protein n=1 Tax=Artemisia annua TaxID=35608 RepID=A0A2U1LYH4_ARTAN|nr:RING/U-box superfamily protein [Artemisia annua]